MTFRTWAEEAGLELPALTIDRERGEGPAVRCCDRRLVAADELVRYAPGDLAAEAFARVRGRFPHMPAAGMYLCGACRETLRREQVIRRADMPASRPLSRPDEK